MRPVTLNFTDWLEAIFWHFFWHFLWHFFVIFFLNIFGNISLTLCLAFFLTYLLTFCLTYLGTSFLTYFLTFCHFFVWHFFSHILSFVFWHICLCVWGFVSVVYTGVCVCVCMTVSVCKKRTVETNKGNNKKIMKWRAHVWTHTWWYMYVFANVRMCVHALLYCFYITFSINATTNYILTFWNSAHKKCKTTALRNT